MAYDVSRGTVYAKGTPVPRELRDRFADIMNVCDFGAKGDGAADDTVAIVNAIGNTPSAGAVFFPSGTYRVTASIQLKTGVALIGCKPVEAVTGERATELVAEGQAAVFLAGAASRVFVDLQNLRIHGTDVEIGIDGQFGGKLDGLYFDHLATGIRNPNGYWCQYIKCKFVNCVTGLDTDVANNIVLEIPFFSACKVGAHIKNGFGVTLHAVGANINRSDAEAILRLENTNFSITNSYFEAWSTVPALSASAVFIDVILNKFASPTVSIQDSDFDAKGLFDHLIYMTLVAGQTGTSETVRGLVARNRFANPIAEAVTYGPDNNFGGIVYRDNQLDVGGLLANEHASRVYRPLTATVMDSGQDISGAAWKTLLQNGTVVYDNVDPYSTNPGRYRVRKTGLYRVSVSATVVAAAGVFADAAIGVFLNGTHKASNTTSIDSAGIDRAVISVSTILNASVADDIDIKGKLGDTVASGTVVIEWLGDGNF